MISITREDVPCWYELGWREDVPAIILRIHKDFIVKTDSIYENHHMLEYFKEIVEFDVSIDSFCGDFNKEFIGFNKVLRNIGISSDFVEFLIDIPSLVCFSNNPCRSCGGSGNSYINDSFCFFCDGKGKDRLIDWKKAFDLSASMSIITQFLYINRVLTGSQFPQLLTVKTTTSKDSHGVSLGGEFGPAFRQWLNGLGDYMVIAEAEKAMKLSYCKMFHVKQVERFARFSVIVRDDGFLTLDCPGNACGIDPDVHWQKGEKGYRFSCHNVDTPMQQLLLISGLASLHDKARREMKKND